MTQELLFIGGVADGRRLTVRDETFCVRVPRMNERSYDQYRRETLSEKHLEVEFFVHYELSIGQAMVRLLANYHPLNIEER